MQVTVGISGTGGGFERFCAGETDISNASRQIEDDEIAGCEKNGVEYAEVQVANDGIAIVVNPENDWVECLTVEQLKKIWEPDSKVGNWNQVEPTWPDQEMKLFGPGTDSGTFDYFTDAINGEEGASRTDYQATEDDNVIVEGVAGEKGGLGYFGLSYAEANADKVKLVQVDGGGGCVTPSTETVQDGTTRRSPPALLLRQEGVADAARGRRVRALPRRQLGVDRQAGASSCRSRASRRRRPRTRSARGGGRR